MRLVRYSCAMSLDGFIAGPQGEYDWIVLDPEMDFAAMMAEFDTFLIGRKTFEAMVSARQDKPPGGIRYVVFSRTLKPSDYPQVGVETDAERVVRELRAQPDTQSRKDIYLFGGGELFRSLLHAGLVDRVEVGLIPVLLGGGIPLLPAPAERTKLRLLRQQLYEKTGTVRVEYEILKR
jgi:dihydrofolate reductase